MVNPLATLKLMSTKKCTYQGCKTKLPDGIIHLKGKWGKDLAWYPDAGYLFHYQDTHGFPHEIMVEELSRAINSEMSESDVALYNRLMEQSLKEHGVKV